MSIRNQQLKRALQNSEKLGKNEVKHAGTTDEDMPDEAMCLERVSHALDTMFEEDYNIISLGMFPEAAQMQSEEVRRFEDDLKGEGNVQITSTSSVLYNTKELCLD